MNTRDGSANAAEVHVHIGRLVVDAQSAGAAGTQGFEAALQLALAQRLGATAVPAGPASRTFSASQAVADAVAARVQPLISPVSGR